MPVSSVTVRSRQQDEHREMPQFATSNLHVLQTRTSHLVGVMLESEPLSGESVLSPKPLLCGGL
jgi:hypothetical protein